MECLNVHITSPQVIALLFYANEYLLTDNNHYKWIPTKFCPRGKVFRWYKAFLDNWETTKGTHHWQWEWLYGDFADVSCLSYISSWRIFKWCSVCIYLTPPGETDAKQHQFFKKSSLTDLKSQFSFYLTSCYTKVKEPSLPYYSLFFW